MILVLQCQVVVGAALNTRPGSPSRLIVLAARVIILIIIVKIIIIIFVEIIKAQIIKIGIMMID